ncbi:hypothetical protein ACH4C6_07475 [Streptomyces sp. NPDC017943]|uniref:hypothetical protein n=1 Tax=Streptomyces sp. NPDC017943 TaxID=3365019 RepID=UPI003788BA94
MVILLLVCCYGVGIAVVFTVAIVADHLIDRRKRPPERWCVPIPGQFPAYVRQDYARARQARATRHRLSTPEE